jgi:hypothetical protein
MLEGTSIGLSVGLSLRSYGSGSNIEQPPASASQLLIEGGTEALLIEGGTDALLLEA